MIKERLSSKIIQNYLYNISYQILMTILPIITIPYLTRVLGSKQLGVARYVESIGNMFLVFGLIGLIWYANRTVAYNRNDRYALSKCFWEIFFMRILLMTATTAVYLVVGTFSEYSSAFAIYMFYLIGNFLDTHWFFTGIEEMKPLTVRNFIVRIISTILLFIVVRSPRDVNRYLLLAGMTYLINAVALFPWIRRYVDYIPFKQLDVRKHFMPSLALFLPQAASQIYVQSDKIMIKYMIHNTSYISYYTENEKLAKVPIILATALSTVLMPRIAHVFSSGKQHAVRDYITKAFLCTCLVLFPCCTGLMAVSRTFVPLFLGPEFAHTWPILVAFCPVMVFIGLSNVTAVQYLVALDRTKELTISYTVACVVNLTINFLLIPRIGIYGALIGTEAAEFLSFALQYHYMHRELGSMHIAVINGKLLALSVIMGMIAGALGLLPLPVIPRLVLQVAAGVMVYGVGCFKLGILSRVGLLA